MECSPLFLFPFKFMRAFVLKYLLCITPKKIGAAYSL